MRGPTFNITFSCSINGNDQECSSLVNKYEDDVGKKHPQDLKLSALYITIPRFVQCYSKTNTAHCTGKANTEKHVLLQATE